MCFPRIFEFASHRVDRSFQNLRLLRMLGLTGWWAPCFHRAFTSNLKPNQGRACAPVNLRHNNSFEIPLSLHPALETAHHGKQITSPVGWAIPAETQGA